MLAAGLGKLTSYLSAPTLVVVAVGQALLCAVWARNIGRVTLTDRVSRGLFGLLLIALASAFAFGYPLLEELARNAGVGSDRDEALELAVAALLRGESPYEVRLSTGNPVSPLPGELILAVPFHSLGHTGWQTVFWLCAWFASLSQSTSPSKALYAAVGLFALGPGALHELVTAGDLLPMALAVQTGVLLLLEALEGGRVKVRVLLACTLLGLALSSRFTWLLLLVPLGGHLFHAFGSRVSAAVLGVVVCVWLAATLPWALSRSVFSPAHIFERIDAVSPIAQGSLVVIVGSCLGAVVAARWGVHSRARLCVFTALVMLIPPCISTVLALLAHGSWGVQQFLWYSLWAVPFAITGQIFTEHVAAAAKEPNEMSR